MPLELSIDDIEDSERCHESKDKKNHKTFICTALSNPKNESLNMVCLEIANAIKRHTYSKEKSMRLFICALITK